MKAYIFPLLLPFYLPSKCVELVFVQVHVISQGNYFQNVVRTQNPFPSCQTYGGIWNAEQDLLTKSHMKGNITVETGE